MKETRLKIKDHSISQEEFELIYDAHLDKYTTQPIPENLDDYYKSSNYISHTDAKTGLVDKLYQFVKRFMLKHKIGLIEQFSQVRKILDIGAGTGDFLNVAKSKGWEVSGLEPNAAARKNAEKKGIHLFESSTEFEDSKFDVISMWHVLEHVPNTEIQIKWLFDHLVENGTAVIAVPNFNSYDAKHYKEFWAAWDVPRHLHHFSAKSIKMLFEKEGFKLVAQKPLFFDSFYVSLLSEKYKNSSFVLLGGFWYGLLSNLKALRTNEYSSLIYVFKKD